MCFYRDNTKETAFHTNIFQRPRLFTYKNNGVTAILNNENDIFPKHV
jgi:hypothetical protein